ncbi:hypothetical protein [Bombella mellum]|uniref:hypothetical protein n=1 Tax=Bombella mellum TaxID=2039288 RepID=UPI0015F58197|nr:hypothetical protein [Bombella mellum]
MDFCGLQEISELVAQGGKLSRVPVLATLEGDGMGLLANTLSLVWIHAHLQTCPGEVVDAAWQGRDLNNGDGVPSAVPSAGQ